MNKNFTIRNTLTKIKVKAIYHEGDEIFSFKREYNILGIKFYRNLKEGLYGISVKNNLLVPEDKIKKFINGFERFEISGNFIQSVTHGTITYYLLKQ